MHMINATGDAWVAFETHSLSSMGDFHCWCKHTLFVTHKFDTTLARSTLTRGLLILLPDENRRPYPKLPSL